MEFAMKNKEQSCWAGVTLVELMIVVAICAVLGLGLSALIRFAMDAWRSGSVKIELQRNGQQAMYRIMRDFKEANASSIGNMAYNSGFEIPLELNSPTGSIYGWQIPLPADVEKIGSGDQNLKSGFFAMKLSRYPASADTDYDCVVSTMEFTGPYLLSGWIKAEGSAKIRLLRDTGGEITSTGSTSATTYWRYFYKVANQQNAGTRFKIRLSNVSPGTVAYFDNVSLCPVEIAFNAVSGSRACRYEKITGLKTSLYRLYYNAADKSLHRQVYDGGQWTDDGPDPLCQYVESLTIKNNNNGSFSIRLILAKPVRGGKKEIYQLDNTIVPVSQ